MSVESPVKEPESGTESESEFESPRRSPETRGTQETALAVLNSYTQEFEAGAVAISRAGIEGSKARFEDLDYPAPAEKEVIRAINTKFREETSRLAREFDLESSKVLLSAKMLRESGEYRAINDSAGSPEGLLAVDLDEFRRMNRIEALRERALTTALADAHDAASIRKFEEDFPPSEWSRKDFFEFTNRYRLAGSAEDEVRIFETAQDVAFKDAPRAREFYALALIKLDRTSDALGVCDDLIKEGFDNGLVRGIMGDAYLRGGEKMKAADAYKAGFKENLSSFCALGWRNASVENLLDLKATEKKSEDVAGEIERQKTLIAGQTSLIRMALEMEGSEESLDYWVNAGALELALIEGADSADIEKKLERALRHADADFKLGNTASRFRRMQSQIERLAEFQDGGEYAAQSEMIGRVATVLEDAAANMQRGVGEGKRRREGGHESEGQEADVRHYLDRTINFRAIMGSLTPTYIPGGIGRTGGRVPDIVINREDVRAFESIITDLDLVDEYDPRAVKNKIEDYVRQMLGVDKLQNLKEASHEQFDETSDAMIDLAGIPAHMRKGTHSITNISASLLTGGDCRETLYAMGALFTTQQKMHLRGSVEKATAHLEEGDRGAFNEEMSGMERITRHELRGQHARVYVRGIAMRQKYDSIQGVRNKDLAAERNYSVESWRAGERLSDYELKNSLLEVGYSDGSAEVIKPAGIHENEAGRPLIPETEGRRVVSLSLLTPVEEHTLSHLYDRKEKTAERADGFYDNDRENGPYSFGEGAYDFRHGYGDDRLIEAGVRELESSDGSVVNGQVYLEPMPYSKTDAMRSLGEGDVPNTVRLMGRFFEVDIVNELKKYEKNESAFPKVTERIREWSLAAREKS